MRNILKKWEYLFERLYPYIFSAIVLYIISYFEINFAYSKSLPSALDGVSTVCALIIGFLGAILPVILGMKNESKFVKYVFENDENKLFLKYIKENILIGILSVVVSLFLYFANEESVLKISYFVFYVWVFLFVLFCLLTYRCLSNMLNLIFSDDSKLEPEAHEDTNNENREKIEEEFAE